ncbi:MAG: hypothetical protein NTY90_00140 [Candidatus Micrarchaeota archaeon]|nr:hypothetical protein [Candidatus Micrarchaeota archaeon]
MRGAFFLIAAAALLSLASAQACQISEMNAADQNQWFSNIFGYFAEEVNGLKESALKNNVPGQVQQVNVYSESQEGYQVRTIASLLNTDPYALGSEFGVYADRTLSKAEAERIGRKEGDRLSKDDVLNYKLSKAQVLTISSRQPDKAGMINKLLGTSPGITQEVSPYQNVKVRMPNTQKDVPLSTILDLPEINSSDCYVSNSDVKGRLEFIAVLDKDLRLGSAYSSAQAPGQQISYSRATASIGPYDGSVVVPAQFERYVTAIGNWASLDMYLTIAESLYISYDVTLIKGQIAKKTAAREELSRLSATGMKDWPKASTAYDQLVPKTGKTLVIEGKTYGASDLKQLYIERSAIPQEQGGITAQKFEEMTHEYFTVPPGGAITQNDVSDSIKAVEGLGLNKEMLTLSSEERVMTDLAKKVQQRTVTTFAFGLGWLGPARFALDLAGSLLLETSAAGRDQYFDFYINNGKYLSDFRKSTDFLGTGGVTDFASDIFGTGVPTKAYETGSVYLINNPRVDRDKATAASTSIKQEAGRWAINFHWEQDEEGADGVMFEDIRDIKDYTSIAFSSRNQIINVGADRQKLTSELYRAAEIAAPAFNFLLYRVESLPASAVGLGQLAIYNIVIKNFIDPAGFNKDEQCDPERVSTFINMYKGLVIASQLEVYALYVGGPVGVLQKAKNMAEFLGLAAKTTVGKTLTAAAEVAANAGQRAFQSKFSNALLFLDPLQLAKQLYGTRGQRYVSYCKDNEYKVVTWQKLSSEKKKGLTDTIQQTGLNQLTKGLNIGDALAGLGQKVQAAQLTDILSFRAFYSGAAGSLNSPKLVYLHLDSGTMQWHSVYNQLNNKQACFRTNYQAENGDAFVVDGSAGVKKLVNGTAVLNLDSPDWKARALMKQDKPGLAMTLVPNKIITAALACGPAPVMEVDAKGRLSAGMGCPGIDCLVSGVLQVTGQTDFSNAIGAVASVKTEKGEITVANGLIYYNAYSGDAANKEVRIPSYEAEDAGIREAGKVVITGEGKVIVSGYVSSKPGEIDAGYLNTIIAENARIEFNPATGTLTAAVYSLGSLLGNSILGMDNKPATNKDAAGKDVPALRVDNVRAKAGYEAEADQFNKALQQIQGATGGFQMLDTPNYQFLFTTDANGNPVLRILDKKTGQVREIPITGPITRDANGNIVVPTKDGNFTFKVDMKDGTPMLSVNGPGISELALLLSAKGQNGILTYNPATGAWEVWNGQDIPWNQNFAKNGLSIFGGEAAKGTSQESFLAIPRGQGTGYTTSPLAAMPAWPEGAWLLAMVGAAAAGAALVRIRWNGS